MLLRWWVFERVCDITTYYGNWKIMYDVVTFISGENFVWRVQNSGSFGGISGLPQIEQGQCRCNETNC